jgi:hypothetical protein
MKKAIKFYIIVLTLMCPWKTPSIMESRAVSRAGLRGPVKGFWRASDTFWRVQPEGVAQATAAMAANTAKNFIFVLERIYFE